ncbi:MAG: HAD family hydrolase [Chitinivibrionales bacterium]|nr:HAD family hydrolase [Chitinivibrionales bacterium]
MKYKAVIFDLDGTLLNTLDDIAYCFNHVLAQYGFPTHPVERYRFFIGEGAKTAITKILPSDHSDTQTVTECLFAYRSSYSQRVRSPEAKTTPYPGIEELLSFLQSQAIACAILSNKPHQQVLECVERYFPHYPFFSIFGHQETLPLKPHPSTALMISQQLQIAPCEILFCGDSDIDMRTAIAAGMVPVGVLWGFRDASELSGNGAAILIERPVELLQYLSL